MPMIKKLVKLGNSYALVIDKPIMDLLGISGDTPMEISTQNGKSLIIKPAMLEQGDEKFKALLAHVNKKFGPALKRLADGPNDQDKKTEV